MDWSIRSKEFGEACDAVNEKENPCPGCRRAVQRMFRPVTTLELGNLLQTTCTACAFVSLYEADMLLRWRRRN